MYYYEVSKLCLVIEWLYVIDIELRFWSAFLLFNSLKVQAKQSHKIQWQELQLSHAELRTVNWKGRRLLWVVLCCQCHVLSLCVYSKLPFFWPAEVLSLLLDCFFTNLYLNMTLVCCKATPHSLSPLIYGSNLSHTAKILCSVFWKKQSTWLLVGWSVDLVSCVHPWSKQPLLEAEEL